jgi:hypothetical protein
MNATESQPRPSAPSFPLLLLVSAAIPLCCLAIVALLTAVRSDYAIPVAFFSFVLSAASVLLGFLGLAFRERPRWLALVGLAASGAVLYAITFIDHH